MSHLRVGRAFICACLNAMLGQRLPRMAGVAVHAMGGFATLPLAAVASIGLNAFMAVCRLRTMEAAPFAFPAGRMD